MPDPQPPCPAADRNLLFGILALQMDFISRDQLVAALNAWVLEKATPLGQILVEHQGLRPQDRDLLEIMVRRHLELHGNDAEKSLAAVSFLGSVREDLSQVADADVQASLAQVSAARPDSDPGATGPFLPGGKPAFSFRALSEAIGPDGPGDTLPPYARFQILGPHAKGGLGEVFVAEDRELHRQVALKEIQREWADDPHSRGRFLLEAEITGGLEHPGIVPVYGLGQYADGRPFYAMRFVQGDNLQQAIRRFHEAEKPGRDPGERSLAFRELLGRYVDVCQAVAYAHSRGVLHRDLKPGNVMLGKYGETLVVDWGLAKAVGRAEPEPDNSEETLRPSSGSAVAVTQAGTALGTPAYMSPEQAAGRLDLLGPASDIYSLGATLYAVLTGLVPFPGRDQDDLLQRVQRGEVVPPRRVQPSVPAALEAVCLKAMALRPQDRYVTALALAADVEHWLADEPVSAYREPLVVRAGRWMRRHKPAVAAVVAAGLVALLLGGAGLFWAQRQAERREQAVDAALGKAADMQRQARWAEARAVLEQAESRLGDGGPEDLRRRLGQARRDLDLVARLDAIRLKRATWVEGGFDSATADRDYAAAFQEEGLGAVGEDPGEVAARVRGSAVRAELVAALDDWACCLGRRRARVAWVLAVARGADPDPWRDRVRHLKVWNSKRKLGRLARGAKAREGPPRFLGVLGMRLQWLGGEAEAVLRAAQARRPGDFWVNFELGYALEEKKQAGEAVGYYRAALAVRPSTFAVHINLGIALADQGKLAGAVEEYRRAIAVDPNLALGHNNLGNALKALGKRVEAIKEYRRAIALDLKDAPAHFNLGEALQDQGKLAAAVKAYHRAIALNPKLAQAHSELGLALQKQGQLAEAIKAYRRAIALDPKDAPAHTNLGLALKAQGKLAEAVKEHRRAIALNPKFAPAHTNLGVVLLKQGKLRDAVRACRRAIALDPKLVQAHNNLGNALKDQGKLVEAVKEYHRAITLDPKFAPAHSNLGNALADQGKLAEAVKEYRRAIALDLKGAKAHNNLGNALMKLGQLAEAVKEFRRAIALDPKFALAHSNLGEALQNQGKLAAAVKAYRRAIALNPKYAPAHTDLGLALHKLGQLDEAVKEYRRAIPLDPKDAKAHYNLGNVLYAQGELAAAVRAYRRAIVLDPKFAPAHNNLGNALADQGKLVEAVKEYRRATVLDPKLVQAHNNLGAVLLKQGKLRDAVRACRRAIALDPKLPQPHGGLGQALLKLGRFLEARRALRRCLRLLPAGNPLGGPITQQLNLCRQLLALDRKLAAIDKGDAKPTGPSEQLGLAILCRHFKQRYTAAAGFFTAAFAAKPQLAEDPRTGNRYHGACASALAAAGRGVDAANLGTKEKTRLRGQALRWLKADLALWSKQLASEKPPDLQAARQALKHWQKDPDLAGVRDPEPLAKLPEVERKEWAKLWTEVAALLKKSDLKKEAEAKRKADQKKSPELPRREK
jgi:tetratricopeptide (TPR) repeat protein/tRNA A-37 threonylcarbamoyl transferase component Bud32